MTRNKSYNLIRKDRIFILILVVFHVIGAIIMLTQGKEGAKLSYLNLLLCGTLVFLSETSLKKMLFPMALIAIGGYCVELIGVHTNYLFGDYDYGDTLGLKLYEVPLIIGINWYVIVVASSNCARLFKTNTLLTAILSAVLCVVLDLLIEPVAIRLDYWTWAQGEIPVYNYVCWFVFSLLFSLLYLKTSKRVNVTSQFLYVIWLMFFTMLNFA